jgi:hypothetical protein
VLLGPPDPPHRSPVVAHTTTRGERLPAAGREARATTTERVGDDTLLTARFKEW